MRKNPEGKLNNAEAADVYLKDIRIAGEDLAEQKIRERIKRKALLNLPVNGLKFVYGIATGGIPAERVMGPIGLTVLALGVIATANQSIKLADRTITFAQKYFNKS